MGEFKGFDRNALFLLQLNKFNDNKDFYETVKEEIKQGAIVPMRQLASDLSDELFRIDPKMNLIPTKMVSRVRRDTRRSKNKEMYRENIWCMFMRDKHQYTYQPCMWFEFFPDRYSYGVGIFGTDPTVMNLYREHMIDNQKRYKSAIIKAEKLGAFPDIFPYKKPKPGNEEIDKSLRPYFNTKYIYFCKTSTDIENLYSDNIYYELRKAIKAFAPLYKLLLEVHEKSIEKGDLYE